ncbi:MAG: dipeptide epimerase, partial [Methylocella sp.]
MLRLAISVERFPIRGNFAISRGAKTEAAVVVAAIEDRFCRGRGEGVPY